jgi:hypothetical protein
MRIVKHDVGYNRWHLTGYSNGRNEDIMFYAWMQEHCAECLCVKRDNYGIGQPHWEIRGGDITQMMLIVMSWS